MPEPVSLALAKQHLRLTGAAEDTLLQGYIAAARGWVERFTGHILVQRQIELTLPAFAVPLKLSAHPIVSVDRISYKDAGAAVLVAGHELVIDRPARIYPAYGAAWPWARGQVTVIVTAGYEAGQEPPELIQAILLLVGHWYSNREAVSAGATAAEVPFAVRTLCDPFRLIRC